MTVTLTFLCSVSRASHIDATIFDTSPKLAFGFCPFIAACVSLKNSAYADTGLKRKRKSVYVKLAETQRPKRNDTRFCGSLGSLFFFFFWDFGFL